jgi:hypothetical protein
MFITSVSFSTENWAVVRPYRHMPATAGADSSEARQLLKHQVPVKPANQSRIGLNVNGTDSYLIDIAEASSSEEETDDDDDDILPSDLYARKDCVRYNGKIKLGLFKGVWLLNYAFGCKNRINRVSSK